MTTTKHTPGPWAADMEPTDDGQIYVYPAKYPEYDNDRKDICDVHAYHGSEQRDANAALIAAAPELLEALNEILHCIEMGAGDERWNAACEAARARVAKAEGR